MGLFDRFKKNKSNGSDFKYLKEIIEGSDEIILDKDIILAPDEEEEFPEGIVLDKNIVIDGNGYSIDAGESTRIFKIISKEVVLKNITLQNGKSEIGGAIYVDKTGTLKVHSSVFKNNNSQNGGAIANQGKLEINDSTFNKNRAYMGRTGSSLDRLITFENKEDLAWKIGGSISNFGNAEISESNFNENKADFAGSIMNFGRIKIIDTTFEKNIADQRDGGAILSIDDLTIKNSKFIKNESRYGDGGAIVICKDARIDSCYFEDNKTHNRGMGPDIYNYVGNLEILNTKFKHSEPVFAATPNIVEYSVQYRGHSSIKVKEDCIYENYEGNIVPLQDKYKYYDDF